MIDIVDVVKSFNGTQVLKKISLSIPEGKTTVILGGSGSGKTVLMKHMIGLLRPDSGQVIVDGQDIAQLPERDLDKVRSKFGMVFQAAALFDSMTIYDNVAFPLREHSRKSEQEISEIVHQKLEIVGLKNVDHKYPAELSGGMRKRVGLARAIALQPKIVLYDEPTTGLDPITTDNVDEMILGAKEKLGVTSVVISHDIASAFNIADKIAFLNLGRIIVAGDPEVVRASKHPEVSKFLSTWFGKN